MADLTGQTILVTRPAPRGQLLCERIEALHGLAIFFPTIAFAPPPNQAAFKEAISQLKQQNWVIFISPQAVTASIKAIRDVYPVWPAGVKIAAVGAGTAQTLKLAGLPVDLQPDQEWHSEGLLQQELMQAVSGQQIAIIRGVGGRELLDKVLVERGASVLAVFAYERVLSDCHPGPAQEALRAGAIHAVVCTSFEGVVNLKKLIGDGDWPVLQTIPLVVMSERIKLLAEGLGFRTIWVTPQASDAAILELLIRHLAEKGRHHDRSSRTT